MNIIHKFKRLFSREKEKQSDEVLNSNDFLTYHSEHRDIVKLIYYYKDDKQKDFPSQFEKYNYFQKVQEIYNQIGENSYIEKIRIKTSMSDAGNTIVSSSDNQAGIIITICARKLGIGSGEGVQPFCEKQLQEFSDVFAHELFHAQNIAELIDKIGIEEFKLIKCSDNKFTKLAWKIFDEYVACRKNAERYHSFNSIESTDRIEKVYNYIMTDNIYDDVLIEHLLYSIATISAFADVSNEQNNKPCNKEYKSAMILQNLRNELNSTYKDYPLSYNAYRDLGDKFELIINTNFKKIETITM